MFHSHILSINNIGVYVCVCVWGGSREGSFTGTSHEFDNSANSGFWDIHIFVHFQVSWCWVAIYYTRWGTFPYNTCISIILAVIKWDVSGQHYCCRYVFWVLAVALLILVFNMKWSLSQILSHDGQFDLYCGSMKIINMLIYSAFNLWRILGEGEGSSDQAPSL